MSHTIRMRGPLMWIELSGTLTRDEYAAVVEESDRLADELGRTPDRIVDTTRLEISELVFESFLAARHRRARRPRSTPIGSRSWSSPRRGSAGRGCSSRRRRTRTAGSRSSTPLSARWSGWVWTRSLARWSRATSAGHKRRGLPNGAGHNRRRTGQGTRTAAPSISPERNRASASFAALSGNDWVDVLTGT